MMCIKMLTTKSTNDVYKMLTTNSTNDVYKDADYQLNK